MKKIISALLAATVGFSSLGLVRAEEGAVTIYVSPNGNDDNPGTIGAPLKTLNKARAAVQQYINSGSNVEVIFREGKYRMSEAVNFTAADGAKTAGAVTYKAYDGERVEFTGTAELDMSKAKRVTDPSVLSRMYESVRNKVVEIDLTTQGLDLSKLKEYKTHGTQHSLNGGEVNMLFQNGGVQTVSEWPNGFGNYTTWDYAESGDILHYTDTEPNRWGAAKYMWIGGYNAYDYNYTRKSVQSVNTENSTITCISGEAKFTSAQSRRWKIYNLLEEIDVPGEYYIDPDTKTLYWYPEESIANSTVELSLANSFLNLQYAENITFKNLCFNGCQGNAIYMKQVKNIDFIGCEITNAGGRGIYVESSIQAETDKDYWQRQVLDGSYDCDILDCRFDNTGHTAIDITGGNVDTLKKSNNRIENNVITRAAQLAKGFPAVYLRGCGNIFEHNSISNCPFHAVNIWGNDHSICYNEIYNVIQEADDCGAIYCGRNTLHRGTEIAYNYIHDVLPTRELVYNFQGAVYLDDSEGGYSVHHNIIVNARIDYIVNGGVDIDFHDNTSVNITRYHFRLLNGGIAENTNNARKIWEGYIADEELYFSRYENLKELIEMGKTNTRDERMAKFTRVVGNLGVNYTELSIGTNTMNYGTIKNNMQIDECSDFVDPEHGDYRIKKGSEINSKMPGLLDEDFDLNQIGAEQSGGYDDFLQLYPKNGQQGVNSSAVDFVWQSATDADRYRLVIAADPQLQNVVYDNTDYYPKTTVEGLAANTVYYWQAYAEDIQRQNGTWVSKSPIFSFATSLYETLDLAHLEDVGKKTEQALEALEIGTEAGQYPAEIKERVSSLVSLAGTMADARLGMLSQKNIDQMASILANSFNSIGQTNKGYVDLARYFSKESDWTEPVQISGDGVVTVSKDITGKNNVGIGSVSHMAGSVIYSFDARLTVPAGYVIFGINKDSSIAPYAAANNGYSFLFKPNLLELHVTNGTSQVIVETVEHNFANDGNFHKIEYGYVNTDIGNIVMLYVDGERVIEYLDVINQAVKVRGGFMMHFSGAGIAAELKQTAQISEKERLDEILADALYRSAKTIIDKYTDSVIAIQEDGNKVFTQTGVYDTEGVIRQNDALMFPVGAISRVFGAEAVQNGAVVTVNGTALAAVEADGTARVVLTELLGALDRPYVYSAEQGLLIVGDIIYMNNLNVMNKTRLLMNLMKDLPEQSDYIFAEHE